MHIYCFHDGFTYLAMPKFLNICGHGHMWETGGLVHFHIPAQTSIVGFQMLTLSMIIIFCLFSLKEWKNGAQELKQTVSKGQRSYCIKAFYKKNSFWNFKLSKTS